MFRLTLFCLPALLALALLIPATPHLGPTEPIPTAHPASPADQSFTGGRAHPLSDREVEQATATIDKLVNASLTAHGMQPNPAIDDATFLRRVYLQIIGRIPTAEEATAFLISTEANRRGQLIGELMNHPGRVHNDFTWWADLLRITSKLGARYPGTPYIDWMKAAIRDNKPYDQIVRELITAEGPALAPNNGATGYYIRDAGMPLDNMANTIQVFLGTRVQCAMCHDHPFDKWTRKEFYELAAYTNSVGISRDIPGYKDIYKKVKEQQTSQTLLNALKIMSETIALGVKGGDKSQISLPHDYQYHDAKPDEKVSAKPLFGDLPPVVDGKPISEQRAKVAYAAWITDPANPRFTQVIANRMWKRAFGLGLIEPVDNLVDTTVASDPALLDYLSKLMISLDYDLKRFSEILYRSAAWQRAATPSEVSASEPYYFPGPILRRLSAEQLWDSLLTLAVPDIDSRTGQSAERLYKFYDDNKGKSAQELFDLAKEFAARREKLAALENEAKELKTKLSALPSKNGPEALALNARMKELYTQRDKLAEQGDMYRMVTYKKNKVGPDQFVRADELSSPAPPGHFLRTFGQSDREIIEGANTSPATTQALTMLNGFIDRELLKEQSVLYKVMLSPRDIGGKVDMLFLSLLTRAPTVRERDLGKQEIAQEMLAPSPTSTKTGNDPGQQAARIALHNLAWVLLNSNEFLFIQ